MAELKHTPGPWTCIYEEDRREGVPDDYLWDHYRVFANDNMGVSLLITCGCCNGILCTPGDGRLIVAAPDLLAACEAMMAAWDTVDSAFPESSKLVEPVETQMRAAVAKATAAPRDED